MSPPDFESGPSPPSKSLVKRRLHKILAEVTAYMGYSAFILYLRIEQKDRKCIRKTFNEARRNRWLYE